MMGTSDVRWRPNIGEVSSIHAVAAKTQVGRELLGEGSLG